MKCCNEVCKLCASCPKTTEFDGTPCAVKAARTVWIGGKGGDDIKALPIDIRCQVPGHEAADGGRRCRPCRHHACTSSFRTVHLTRPERDAGLFPHPAWQTDCWKPLASLAAPADAARNIELRPFFVPEPFTSFRQSGKEGDAAVNGDMEEI